MSVFQEYLGGGLYRVVAESDGTIATFETRDLKSTLAHAEQVVRNADRMAEDNMFLESYRQKRILGLCAFRWFRLRRIPDPEDHRELKLKRTEQGVQLTIGGRYRCLIVEVGRIRQEGEQDG